MKILTGRQATPRRVLFHGTNWVGKSTWASKAPNVIFMNIEDGADDLNCSKTELIRSLDQFGDCMNWLINQEHDFRWVAVDTVDWLDKLIKQQVCLDKQKASFADDAFSYGKGEKFCREYWSKIILKFDMLRTTRKMGVILLAHTSKEKIEKPDMPAYHQMQPALHHETADMLCDWCDEVFFGDFKSYVATEDAGFNRTRAIACGGQDRFIRTVPSAGVRAKNRLFMDAEIPVEWSAYQKAMDDYYGKQKSSGNIDGIVKDGSSKK